MKGFKNSGKLFELGYMLIMFYLLAASIQYLIVRLLINQGLGVPITVSIMIAPMIVFMIISLLYIDAYLSKNTPQWGERHTKKNILCIGFGVISPLLYRLDNNTQLIFLEFHLFSVIYFFSLPFILSLTIGWKVKKVIVALLLVLLLPVIFRMGLNIYFPINKFFCESIRGYSYQNLGSAGDFRYWCGKPGEDYWKGG